MRLLHLSDTHVSASGPDEDGVDAVGALERLLHDVRHVADLGLVVVSGDVADDGSAKGAATVRELVGGFARDRGIPHVYCPGNHDRRPGFRAALGSGHLGADGADVGIALCDDGSLAAVSTVTDGAGPTRVVTLDSLVVGETRGKVGDDQLDALRRLLAEPAPGGTVLVLHHPPIAVPGVPFTADVVLQDPAALGEAIRGSDVRVVLAGHLHLQLSGSLAGVPVWATPGVVSRIDLTAPFGATRGVLGASATVVDLVADGAVTTHLLHARDPRAGEPVYCYDPVTGADVADTD